jgi:hypothetical protein
MEKLVSIEFDVAWDESAETFADVMAEIAARTGAMWSVEIENGPGGGWPSVRFTVRESKLDELIEALGYGDDLEWERSKAWEA